MPVLIKPVQRVDPSKPTEPKKWYIVQTTTRQVDETEVAMELSDETTLNASEAMMAIRQLRKIVIRHLKAGESVKLGNWGSFNLSLSTQGNDKLPNYRRRVGQVLDGTCPTCIEHPGNYKRTSADYRPAVGRLHADHLG